jgi:uncharacterized protein (DUF433 family)
LKIIIKIGVFTEKVIIEKYNHKTMVTYTNRIVSDYKTMHGKPIIKGTRLTVEIILRKLAEGAAFQDLLDMYPKITNEDILACLQYAADIVANEEVIDLEKAS